MAHHCHVPRCGVAVPPKFLMCRRHWHMVPAAEQRRVWLYYREGQEIDKRPSEAYLRAAEAAIRAVQAIEPHLCRECGVDTRHFQHAGDCRSRVLLLPGVNS